MASEAVVSDHSALPQQVKEEVKEEGKTIGQENVSPAKESEEEEKGKSADTPSPDVPLAESVEKIEDKKTEPPVIEEVKQTDEEEKPKAEDSPSPAVPLAESVEKIEDKQTEPPVLEEVKKIDDTPKVAKEDSTANPDMLSASEPIAVSVKNQPEEEPATETIRKLGEVESTIDSVEEKPEEQPKIVDVPDSSVEAVEKKEEQVEDLPVKESESYAAKVVENFEAESKNEEIPEAVPALVEKPQEQSEVTGQIEKESTVVEPKGTLEVEIAKNEETSAEKVEDAKLLKEEETTKEEPLVTESLGQVISTNIDEAKFDPKGDGEKCPTTEVNENASTEDKEKEVSGKAEVIEGLSKGEVVEPGKVEVENEAKNVKTEKENGEVNVITEESAQPEMKEVEDVTSSISTAEVSKKSLEEGTTSRDIDLVAENGKQNAKDETLTPVETSRDVLEGKVDEIPAGTIKEPVEEPQKPEVEVKGEETVQPDEPKSEKEKEVDDTAKPDAPNPESTKNLDDTHTSQDPPKEEVSSKSTQKQSNNILAKVKQSLVKAKKAIIGKSPNSKTPSSETKGDV